MAAVNKLKTLGTVTVATAGTPVQLFPNSVFSTTGRPRISSFLVRSLDSNTDPIFVGDANVNRTTVRGDKLNPGESRAYSGDAGMAGGTMLIDTEDVWIDAGVNGQSVDVCYLEVI